MFGRGILGMPMLYRTFTCEANHIIVKLLGVGLVLQSFHFMRTMVSILKSRSAEYAERKRKNIKMKWFTALTREEIDKVDAYKAKPNKKQYVP
jgi:hypothetical protein